MALDTYANLKVAIRDWSHRNDMGDDRIDDFIDMAEAEMYGNLDQPIRLRSMEARATATVSTSSRFLALPDLFLQMRRLKLNLAQEDTDVKYMAPEQMPLRGTSGIPRFFSVTTQLEFDRTPDSTYTIEMQYIKKLTPLSDSNTTNAILTDSPTVYLFGALWALHKFTSQPEVSADYYIQFINSIGGANIQDKKGKYGPAPRIRLEGSTP